MFDNWSNFQLTICPLCLQLHVVHYNSDKYKSFQEASDKPDGLAVLAFFYEVRSEDRLFIFLFLFYVLLVNSSI